MKYKTGDVIKSGRNILIINKIENSYYYFNFIKRVDIFWFSDEHGLYPCLASIFDKFFHACLLIDEEKLELL